MTKILKKNSLFKVIGKIRIDKEAVNLSAFNPLIWKRNLSKSPPTKKDNIFLFPWEIKIFKYDSVGIVMDYSNRITTFSINFRKICRQMNYVFCVY